MAVESDEELYARMSGGDLSAFDRLYARYERSLFGFIRRMTADRAEAEDVFHEAFLALLRERNASFERGGFRAWLFGVARNAALNRIRSRARGERAGAALAALAPPPEIPADELVARGEQAGALERAVEALPRALADLWRLRASGMSYEEMAEATGAPLGTVKSRMHDAVNRVREEMKRWNAA